MAQQDLTARIAQRERASVGPWSAHLAGRRLRHNGPVLAVVLLVTLLSTSVLVALGQLVVVTQSTSIAQTLAEAEDIDLRVETLVRPGTTPPSQIIGSTEKILDEALSGLPGRMDSWTRSASYGVARTGDPEPQVAVVYVAAYSDVESKVELVSGRWPEGKPETRVIDVTTTRGLIGSPLPDYELELPVAEVALPHDALDILQIKVGDVVALETMIGYGAYPIVEVVGTWRGTDTRDDPYWRYDRTFGEGHIPGSPLPTAPELLTDLVGPALTTPATFDTFAVEADQVQTSFTPDISRLTAQQASALVGPASDLPTLVREGSLGSAGSTDVSSRLGTTLADVLAAAAITEASMVVVGLVLLVLVVSALLQATRLLVEARASEVTLLRARGGSSGQVLRLAGVEAAWLALVTACAGPFLGAALYGLISRSEPMRTAGLTVVPPPGPIAWSVAAACAVLLVIVLLAPLVRREGSFVEAEAARARPPRSTFIQRSGLDLVLVALAGLAVWQLRRYSSPVAGSGAVAGVDPLLAAGPALVLLAGALLAARLVPLLARLAELVASRGRGVVGSLAAWEIGRRATRTVAAVVLLALALAVGTFCLTFLRTWSVSQAEQAQFQVGSDVRVLASLDPALVQGEALTSADVTSVRPVLREQGVVGFPELGKDVVNEVNAQVLALDKATLDELASGPLAQTPVALAAPALTATDIAVEGITLPVGTNGFRADVRFTASSRPGNGIQGALRAIVRDANGVVQPVDVGASYVGLGRWTLVGQIVRPPDATALAEPLELIGLHTNFSTGNGATLDPLDPRVAANPDPGTTASQLRTDLFSLEAVRIVEPEGAEPPVLKRFEYNDLPECAAGADGAVTPPDEGGLCLVPTTLELASTFSARHHVHVARPSLTPSGTQAELAYTVGSDGWSVHYLLLRSAHIAWEKLETIPAVLTRTLADKLGIDVGAQLVLVARDVPVTVDVTAIVPDLPSTTPDSSGILVELDALTLASAQRGGDVALASEWWVDLAGPAEPALATDARYAQHLEAAELTSLASLAETTSEMRDSPVRVGTPVVLWLVTLTAALLAALGFTVRTTVTLRARAVEFSQLRAIGLHRRSLVGVVALETVLLSLLGTGLGIGLGAGLGHLVTPLVSLTTDGEPAVPPVSVVVPWDEVALLAVGVCVALAVVMATLTRQLRVAEPATVLRAGDER